jgi:uncharacterized sodium:solute symporter family permease YidK
MTGNLDISIWFVSLYFCVALIGLIYSTTGGLKSIVISDMLLAIGLFISGFLFLYFAFRHWGMAVLNKAFVR